MSSMDSSRSQRPLSTHACFPERQVMPPLDRKYGGSAKIRSTSPSSPRAGRTSMESPTWSSASAVQQVHPGPAGVGLRGMAAATDAELLLMANQ